MTPGIPPPGFRLPESTTVGRVIVRIGDLERSLGFYRDFIGLSVLSRDESSAALGAASANAPVLLELRQHSGLRSIPRRGLLGIYHFALLLPDRPSLGRFLRHVRDEGAHPGAADHLVSEALYLTDPDGIVIEVYRDRPRDAWTLRDHELEMASDPIDAAGLIAAGGHEPWRGVPDGSRIGHVHFYVGDLAAAESFYHVALGFDKTAWSFPGALFLAAGGYHHHVGTNVWAAGAPVATPADAGLISWELVLPDRESIEALGRNVRSAGYVTEPKEGGVLVGDPWGIAVHATAPAK